MGFRDVTADGVRQAMAEFDQLGREAFLNKYGFGPARDYFLVHDGRRYDSKAIVGAAHGHQFPQLGPLGADAFSGGEQTVGALLRGLGYSVEGVTESDGPRITGSDIRLMRQSRSRAKYADFSDDERLAHARIHNALKLLGALARNELGGRDYELKLTSGFHPASGIRGGKPKDLWFGIFRKENEQRFLGNPQLFMIVSGRGIEYGFAPLTHPDDFSNQEIKQRTRAIARSVLEQLPVPGSLDAIQLGDRLSGKGTWHFRRKQRLEPNQSEFPSLDAWLSFLHSEEGVLNAGGGLTRYVLEDDINDALLADEVRHIAQVFQPLMDRIMADAPPSIANAPAVEPRRNHYAAETIDEPFSSLLATFLRELAEARKGPFQKTEALWSAMSALKSKLEQLPSIYKRSDLIVGIGVGQGNWATVPWISILKTTVTQTAEEGIYVVFLIAQDLDRVFLTLSQGTTTLINELGPREAQKRLLDVAARVRPHISSLMSDGFTLDNQISLGGTGWRARSYEIGTIAHLEFRVNDIPDDSRIDKLLESLLIAYDLTIAFDAAVDSSKPAVELVIEETPPAPYVMDDALSELFLEQPALERLLTIWSLKKNLILQGAPGVGKSFIAKRLAYLLLGARDTSRVETIQFHQSYSYEDFVQGYRPDGKGGFELRDGVFHRFCEKASLSPNRPHVFIIDEINRGNLSKIFGELMLLIEHDKRGPSWAAALTYSKPDMPRFFVPENVYLLGMMNTADRSLSMVDYALRRRFSFAVLEPMFASTKFHSLLLQRGVPESIVTLVVTRMSALNSAIGEDRTNLGAGYRIGHSFFVPPNGFEYDSGWYRRIVETEIHPLLEEYWFDDPDKADSWLQQLAQGAP